MKKLIVEILLKLLWKFADDISYSTSSLKELYNDVPKELDNEVVEITTIHVYDNDNGNYKKIMKWLDED